MATIAAHTGCPVLLVFIQNKTLLSLPQTQYITLCTAEDFSHRKRCVSPQVSAAANVESEVKLMLISSKQTTPNKKFPANWKTLVPANRKQSYLLAHKVQTWTEWAEDQPWLWEPGCCECGGSPWKWGWRCSPRGVSCPAELHPWGCHWWRDQDLSWRAVWEVLQSLKRGRERK